MSSASDPQNPAHKTGSRRSKRKHAVALNCQQRKIARCIGAGIDIRPVGTDVRLAHRRMAMDDILSKMLLAGKEFLANPEHVLLLLLGERHARLHSGVNEEEVAAHEAQPEAVEESSLVQRNGQREFAYQFRLFGGIGTDRWTQSVRGQGLQPAILLPVLQLRGILQDVEQERFMVTFEENRFMPASALDQQIDGLAGFRAAIDVVAEKDINARVEPIVARSLSITVNIC